MFSVLSLKISNFPGKRFPDKYDYKPPVGVKSHKLSKRTVHTPSYSNERQTLENP